MSEHYTDLAKMHVDALDGKASSNVRSIRAGARIQIATGVFVGEAVSANDTIKIARIPAGAIVLPELSSVTSEGLGTLQITIGTDDNPTAYGASMAVGSTGTYAIAKGTSSVSVDALKEPAWVTATASGTPAVTAGKRLKFVIAYVIA